MDYMIEHYKDIDTDPAVFLQRFRCTTEPIGGSTELDEQGELVDWDAAVVALDIAKKQFIEKTCYFIQRLLDSHNLISLKDGKYKSAVWLEEQIHKEMEN